MEQKLLQYLTAHRNGLVMQGLAPISPGMDVSYEAGRRIGVAQGMDLLIKCAIDFFTDQETKDKEL